MARGRESETEIEARLSRAGGFARLNHAKLLRFSNNDALHVTGPAFVELILAQTMVVTCV
jgi:ribose 1,5-bisphosphokinase PhnN